MAHVPGNNIRSAIAIGTIMKRVIDSGKLTRSDERFFLQAMTFSESLDADDLKILNNLMKRMDMGLIKLVED